MENLGSLHPFNSIGRPHLPSGDTIVLPAPKPTAATINSADLGKGDVFTLDGIKDQFKVVTIYNDDKRGKWIIATGRSFHCSQVKTVTRIKAA